MEQVDLLVVGGGKAGKSLAMAQAKKGWEVAMVERQYVGGTCINVACIPTKSLVASARRMADTRSDATFGVEGTEGAKINLNALRAHKEGVVGGMVAAHEKMFAAPGLDFICGEAKFTGPKTIEVTLNDGGVREITGDKVLVNLGAHPSMPPIPGLKEAGAWTSEDILRLETIPESLAIIGGGYIGVEFSQMMAEFGSKVTLIASGEHVLPREDADIAQQVEAGLLDSGVTIKYGVRAVSVSGKTGEASDSVSIELSDGSTVSAAAVLVAAGRVPNTDGIGLDKAGIDLDDRGMIVVDDQMRTSAPDVWAAGDSAGTPMFTHASWHDFRIIRAQFNGENSECTSKAGRLIPYTVFTMPELARIGLSEDEARAQGLDIKVAKIPANAIPRAKTMRIQHGMWKAIVEASTGKILGATLVGPESGEVITALQVAIASGMTYQQLRFLPIAHPTMGEGLNILFDQLD